MPKKSFEIINTQRVMAGLFKRFIVTPSITVCPTLFMRSQPKTFFHFEKIRKGYQLSGGMFCPGYELSGYKMSGVLSVQGTICPGLIISPQEITPQV